MEIVTRGMTFFVVTAIKASRSPTDKSSRSPTNGPIFLWPFEALPIVSVAHGWEL